MNPYVAFALAMCVIVFLSLGATAYLALAFNRRAKADLAAALEPLARAIDGEIDLEGASLKGRRAGHLVFGRVANAPGGIGRLFYIDVIDAAGGTAWEWSSLPGKNPSQPPVRAFESADQDVERRLAIDWANAVKVIAQPERERFGFLYDPVVGHVRLVRAMRTRRDVPNLETFLGQVDVLVSIARANRRAQGAPIGEDEDAVSAPALGMPRHGTR